MIERDEIILMIEQMDTAAAEAQKEIDHSIALLTESDDVTAVAAAQQLKAAVMDGIMVQSGGIKDMTIIYEIAKETKKENDMLLVQDILFWRMRLQRALVFARIWKICLNGLSRSILKQRYKEMKIMKEIKWNGRTVSRYEIDKACNEGITELQKRMAFEGFKE